MKKFYLLSLAFVSGLTIMAVEISASRLIAPYFGTSTFIWVNIIGVIMVALALGYYFGGKLADKVPDLKLLLKLILGACVFLLITPFVTSYAADLVTYLLVRLNSASAVIFIGSLVLVSILLFIPIFILGMASPFIIKLLSTLDTNIGQDAGLVFSISTVGSILGTFLPMLIFIPLIGTRRTIIIFACLLIFVVLIGLFNKKWSWLSLLALLLVFIQLPAYKEAQGAIFEGESVYQYFQVADEDNFRYLKINEGLGVFSVINKDPNNVLTDSYFDYYNLLPYLDGNSKKQDMLVIGLAGGTISTQLNHFFSQDYDLKIDGVEIDDKLIDVARKYFNLDNDSLTVHNLDGRIFLNFTDKKYNAIVVDAYANQLYIPFHLASLEFFQSVKGHLADNGVVAMNVNATSSDSALLKAITNTMNKVFAQVYILPLQDWNYLVMAGNQPLDFPGISKIKVRQELQPLVEIVQNNYQEAFFDPKFQVLTDDKAPIEYLTDWMILDYALRNKI
ncbi:MAG: fused MFS/spermidine synthase [Candidatus Parcubacteria bacterium]|nr:fused MFS/spermidine synthase [Candidatus Parcubacteria bacterium]